MKLYNSATGEIKEFSPNKPNEVSLYYCGPTVQSGPHVGHLMSAVIFDQLIRWFEFSGYKVKAVRNVTDIDDKILAKATEDTPWWQLAHENEEIFNKAYRQLNVKDMSYVPHATAHIPEIIALIQNLIDGGHAYEANGNVFFSVRSWDGYGMITRQKVENMVSSEVDELGKKDVLDFALWKAAKTTEPEDATWDTPWGRGRPGWHIECSAMSTKYLGKQFDIHGGGLDLRFPHHENENAQAKAADYEYANIWMHHGMVNVENQKMSKSIGNVLGPDELFSEVRPAVVRYFLSTAHYRSTLDFTMKGLHEAETALNRIEKFIARFDDSVVGKDVPTEFKAAMDDDLSVPTALAIVHETVRAGNKAISNNEQDKAKEFASKVLAMMDVLGIELAASGNSADNDRVLGTLVEHILEQRSTARKNKDWDMADKLRELLNEAGIKVEDGADGATWRI
ncbi:MAG: cysteine--tRNA ligase [Micrococcaceae bacterium]